MNVLFVHNNFPAQYRHLAARLVADPANLVAAIGSPTAQDMPGVILRRYELGPQDVSQTHPFARRFDLECRRAERVLYAAVDLKGGGFRPDVIMVHSGWGENLPLRVVFPGARIIVYCEFLYSPIGQDVGFDTEFLDLGIDSQAALVMKNASQAIGLVDADLGISPTQWQRATFPAELRSKVTVLHEGIDTQLVAPDPEASFELPSGKVLRKGDEIITYVARSLEPLRGFHVVMRALPAVLAARPEAQVIVVGGTQVSYGASAPDGTTWKDMILAELGPDLDLRRVHFLGNVTYDRHLALLRVSAVHTYFTYPFVLSWSFLEAMAAQCVVLCSDVGPTREFMAESRGLLVPFHDIRAISRRLIQVLSDIPGHAHLGAAARGLIVDGFDLQTVVLPKFTRLLLAGE